MFSSRRVHSFGQTIFGDPIHTSRSLPTPHKRIKRYYTAASAAASTLSSLYRRKKMPKRLRSSSRRSRGNNATKKRRFASKKRAATGKTGVTFQHDTRRIYTKKKMNPRKKRKWTSFIRKVGAVSDKSLGARQVVFNKSQTFTNLIPGNQGLIATCLYGLESASTGATYFNDLKYISFLENATSADELVNGELMRPDTQYMFQSGVLDLTLTNSSFVTNGTTVNPPILELDLYDIIMTKEAELNATNYNRLDELFLSTLTVDQVIKDNNAAPGVVGINMQQRGTTPFDMSRSLSAFGIKIMKKTKYFISPGQTVTYQVRDPKKHSYLKKKLQGPAEGFNKPYTTKHQLMVFKGVPGPYTLGNADNQVTERVSLGITRKYMYKIRGFNNDASLYVNR